MLTYQSFEMNHVICFLSFFFAEDIPIREPLSMNLCKSYLQAADKGETRAVATINPLQVEHTTRQNDIKIKTRLQQKELPQAKEKQ